jgi:hypothetical protein
MSPKGKKAASPKTKGPASSPVENRIPARSPIDDGMRSQMHNLSPALQGTPALSVRRRFGGKPILCLDMDPTSRKRKQKDAMETSPPLNDHVAAGNPNLGSLLEHAVDNRRQQVQQQVLSEQTPTKERIERESSDKESDKGSSSVGGNSALESPKGSGSNSDNLSSFSILQENPKGTIPKWGDLLDESAEDEGDDGITIVEEENKDKESAKGSVPLLQESAKGSGTVLPESNPDAFTSTSASAPEPSDWITNRLNRLRNLPLSSARMEQIIPPSVPRGRCTAEDRDKWIKFLSGTAAIEQSFSSSSAISSSTLESLSTGNAASSASASSAKDVPSKSWVHPYNDAENLEPRFLLTDDIMEAIDALIEQGVEEVMPEQLLLGHFKFLFENGKLNNTDDVNGAYTPVLGLDDLGIISPDPHRPAISQE